MFSIQSEFGELLEYIYIINEIVSCLLNLNYNLLET